MLQPTPQFAPHQLLESGRRAEADGRFDYAAQFYRHVTDQYPYSAEAAEARIGLGRIGAAVPAPPPQNGSLQVWQGPSNGAYGSEPRRNGSAARRRLLPQRDHYRTGRGLAVIVRVLGWLVILGGLAAPPAIGVLGLMRHFGLPVVAGGAVSAVVAGMLLVFLGQMARALFDQANATRELLVLERARNGSELH